MKKHILIALLTLSLISPVFPCFAEGEDAQDTAEATEISILEENTLEAEIEEEEDVQKESAEVSSQSEFITVFIECPEAQDTENITYQDYTHLLLRYADDKTPIPLSLPYDRHMYATIPSENADRPLECFTAEDKEFTDTPNFDDYYSDDSFAFYIMGLLSGRKIIEGNEKGEALPFNNITRAEAVAMAMRLLGVDKMSDTDSGFDDVSKDEWFAPAVTKARKLGIVAGDDETHFSPMRNVSREELVALVARCLWKSGLQEETKVTREELMNEINFADGEEISDWALSAYNTLKTYGTADYISVDYEEGEEVPEAQYLADPKGMATRFFASYVMLDACDMFQVYPSQTAISFGFDKAMPIIDGSTSTYPFTEEVYRMLFSNGFLSTTRPKAHSKSHASYERLINGEVDMLFASVYPAKDILNLAKENGVELELIPIAYDAMIFFTNMDNSIKGLTTEQISEIYVNNRYSNWKELGGGFAKIYPYCRNNDSGSHAQMERHFLNGNEINKKIQKETTSWSMSNILTDVMNSQTEDPKGYGLGYSIYYYFQNMDMFYDTNEHLKLLEINGVYPDDETIASGEYPLSNNTYVVLRKDEPEGSPARKMAEYMLTKDGQTCVENAGFGAINPPYPKEFYYRNTSSSFELMSRDGETPIISASIRYPQITNKKNLASIDRMNKTFKEIADDFEEDIRSRWEGISEYFEEEEYEVSDMFPYENYLYYDINRNTDGIFSITFTTSIYTGGAHPYGDKISFTYDTKKKKELTLSDVLGNKNQSDTNQFVIDKFYEEFSDENLWDLEEEAPYVSFYIDDFDLVMYFNEYQIGPYAMGLPEVRIPLSELNQ